MSRSREILRFAASQPPALADCSRGCGARQHGGPPIVGAIVIGELIGASQPPSQGSTDEKGRFELLRQFGSSLIYVRDPNGDLAGYATVGEGDDTELTIIAKPVTTVRGQVVDSDGKPLRGRARLSLDAPRS